MPDAPTKDKLWEIFERGSENRHVASTSKNNITNYSFLTSLLVNGVIMGSLQKTSRSCCHHGLTCSVGVCVFAFCVFFGNRFWQ